MQRSFSTMFIGDVGEYLTNNRWTGLKTNTGCEIMWWIISFSNSRGPVWTESFKTIKGFGRLLAFLLVASDFKGWFTLRLLMYCHFRTCRVLFIFHGSHMKFIFFFESVWRNLDRQNACCEEERDNDDDGTSIGDVYRLCGHFPPCTTALTLFNLATWNIASFMYVFYHHGIC